MFIIELVPTEADDRDQWNLDIAAGGLDAGQHPVDFGRMGKAEDHLIYYPIGSYGP